MSEPTTPLSSLDKQAQALGARVITKQAIEEMTRLAYEKGLADGRSPLTDNQREAVAQQALIGPARSTPAEALDVDRLTAIIESRMSLDLAWLGDDGETINRFGPEQVAHALMHLYRTGDVVSGLPPLRSPESDEAR